MNNIDVRRIGRCVELPSSVVIVRELYPNTSPSPREDFKMFFESITVDKYD
jgi:hypothetical protein